MVTQLSGRCLVAGGEANGRMKVLIMNEVNKSIIRHMSEYPFWTDKARQGLIDDIGEDGLKHVRDACDFASGQTDLWLHRPFAEAGKKVAVRLRGKYPDLDEEATKRIVAIVGYSWK